MLACACVLSKQRPSQFQQMLLTIGLSLTTVTLRLYEGLHACCRVHAWNRHLSEINDNAKELEGDEKIRVLSRNLASWECSLWICLVLFVGIWMYSIAKCAGVFLCDQNVFNLNGCAKFNATSLEEIVNRSMHRGKV